MKQAAFKKSIQSLFKRQEKLLSRRNRKAADGNGIYDRYDYPVLTAAHAPLIWRYDLDPKTNPYLMERMFINTTFNAGAIFHEGKYLVVARVEGADLKSFFAVAESPNGIDNFRFWDYPILMPETENPDTNVYDIRARQARRRMDLRPLLHRAQKPRGAGVGYLLGSRAVRHCPHQRSEELGAACRSSNPNRRSSATSCCIPNSSTASTPSIPGHRMISFRPARAAASAGDFRPSIENAVVDEEIILDNREISHHPGGQKRPRPRAHQDREGLAASGAWRAQHRRRTALRALSVPYRTGAAVGGHAQAGGLLHRPGGRRARRRCLQRRLQQRLDRAQERRCSLSTTPHRTRGCMWPPAPSPSCSTT